MMGRCMSKQEQKEGRNSSGLKYGIVTGVLSQIVTFISSLLLSRWSFYDWQLLLIGYKEPGYSWNQDAGFFQSLVTSALIFGGSLGCLRFIALRGKSLTTTWWRRTVIGWFVGYLGIFVSVFVLIVLWAIWRLFTRGIS